MASQGWCADRLADWLKKNPTKGATDCKDKLEDDFGIRLKYSKAWSGMKVALDQIHGKYEESFQLLFNWAAQIKQVSPGSLVEIELEKIEDKYRFSRMFVALRPCVDGFLAGCRPFIGVDASALHGKYRGQLASATGVELGFEIPDKSQWLVVELGFEIHPPLLGRGAGRPKVVRQRGCLEKKATKKKVKCKRCGGFGHFPKTCKPAKMGEDGQRAPSTWEHYIFCSVEMLLFVLTDIIYIRGHQKFKSRTCTVYMPYWPPQVEIKKLDHHFAHFNLLAILWLILSHKTLLKQPKSAKISSLIELSNISVQKFLN